MQSQSRRHIENIIDIGTSRLRHPSSGVRGKRLKIATRTFSVQNPQSQRAFSRSRYTRNTNDAAQWNIDIDIFQVMNPSSPNLYASWPLFSIHPTALIHSLSPISDIPQRFRRLAPFQARHSEHIVAPLFKRNIAYIRRVEMRRSSTPRLCFFA